MTELRPNETLDDLQNGYMLIQQKSGFRFGVDAVLLSAFASLRKNDRVMDLCSGSGIVPILLAARQESISVTGLEIQESCAERAERSVAYNHLEDRISIAAGDLREAASLFDAASFDVVTANPPYMIGQHGLRNPDESMAIARHEVCCTFDDVARAAAYLLKPGGRFYLVHRPFRLAELFRTLSEHRLEPKRMRLVSPFAGREPNLVLIGARKGGRPRITVEAPLILYEKPGVYTDEVLRMYGRTSIKERKLAGKTDSMRNAGGES